MKKKIILLYFLLGVAVLTLTTLFIFGTFVHPEKAILGEWKQVSWNYEKVDLKSEELIVQGIDKNNTLDHDIFKSLTIHESEIWRFSSNASVEFSKKNSPKKALNWRLKGRGHILKIIEDGEPKEYYQIKELTNKRMVLHFENDVHARGIVKIVFLKQT